MEEVRKRNQAASGKGAKALLFYGGLLLARRA